MELVAYDTKIGRIMKPGDIVESFRGELGKLVSFDASAGRLGTGRIYVRFIGGNFGREFFPEVCNIRFVQSTVAEAADAQERYNARYNTFALWM